MSIALPFKNKTQEELEEDKIEIRDDLSSLKSNDLHKAYSEKDVKYASQPMTITESGKLLKMDVKVK